ncbi:transcriptional regulator, AraC family with amidase-like domain [Chryseolinea serpens]|uniref:Transcriptional regulator, AraC family with amidase-like domain n=1 Tax=Chryseolinea serpens TaxID=947013 RepID=A0A1M5MQV3_9BACT|nr:helix-turn-helix domain-containing protein [Chryseolinea serpens]SHG79678.1 transcriptional regulator, AraC family with amidase-like domain [Chryseolinea serpens]
MKTIAIVIAENAVASSITDTLRLFDKANELLLASGRKKMFDLSLVAFTKEIFVGSKNLFFKADKTLDEMVHADLIIIPALLGDVIKSTQQNRHYFPWLIKQYKQGTEIASYCVGAFILAATGLLKGKKCATHWMYSNEFTFYYPDVTLVDDKIITEQNGIYTSGGGTSYWNLLLFLLEKYTDREIVIAITKFFLLDIQRTSQASFMMFRGQKGHGDKLIEAVQEYIENNFQEKFNVTDIASKFSIVRRTLERRFKNATKNSIVEYIQRIKVEAAKKELELGRKTVNEIMWEIGYSDMKTFRDLFLKTTALTPVEYRNRYNKNAS